MEAEIHNFISNVIAACRDQRLLQFISKVVYVNDDNMRNYLCDEIGLMILILKTSDGKRLPITNSNRHSRHRFVLTEFNDSNMLLYAGSNYQIVAIMVNATIITVIYDINTQEIHSNTYDRATFYTLVRNIMMSGDIVIYNRKKINSNLVYDYFVNSPQD